MTTNRLEDLILVWVSNGHQEHKPWSWQSRKKCAPCLQVLGPLWQELLLVVWPTSLERFIGKNPTRRLLVTQALLLLQ